MSLIYKHYSRRINLSIILLAFFALPLFCQESVGDSYIETINDANIEFTFVEGGSFIMGSPETDPYNKLINDNFGPGRELQSEEIVGDFYISTYEITYEQYIKIEEEYHPNQIPNSPPNSPVGYQAWWDAIRFCNRLSILAGKEPYYLDDEGGIKHNIYSDGYRLPTEAEWEYAAKGGKYNILDEPYNIDLMSWYKKNSQNVSPVGQRTPNALGLYDMTGNVWEWVEDRSKHAPFQDKVTYHVTKGGCYLSDPAYCRPAASTSFIPTIRDKALGIRLVRNIPPKAIQFEEN